VEFLFVLPLVLAVGYELGDDVLRAARLTGQLRASEAALRQSEHRMTLAAEAARELSGRLINAQEDERRRIARELHDGIGQNLTAIKHQLAVLQAQLPAAATEESRRLGNCIDLCAQTLEDTRQLSRLLRPQVLDDLGLEAALHWLARSVQDQGKLQVAVHLESTPALDPELQTLLFRVCQEALTNVARHARASDALVRLDHRGGRLLLTVWDNGGGFDVAAAAGLSGMRERLALYGGALRLDSDPETGTWLRASVPLSAMGARP
jgi:two-component system sensor histidine kinase UhpB